MKLRLIRINPGVIDGVIEGLYVIGPKSGMLLCLRRVPWDESRADYGSRKSLLMAQVIALDWSNVPGFFPISS